MKQCLKKCEKMLLKHLACQKRKGNDVQSKGRFDYFNFSMNHILKACKKIMHATWHVKECNILNHKKYQIRDT